MCLVQTQGLVERCVIGVAVWWLVGLWHIVLPLSVCLRGGLVLIVCCRHWLCGRHTWVSTCIRRHAGIATTSTALTWTHWRITWTLRLAVETRVGRCTKAWVTTSSYFLLVWCFKRRILHDTWYWLELLWLLPSTWLLWCLQLTHQVCCSSLTLQYYRLHHLH